MWIHLIQDITIILAGLALAVLLGFGICYLCFPENIRNHTLLLSPVVVDSRPGTGRAAPRSAPNRGGHSIGAPGRNPGTIGGARGARHPKMRSDLWTTAAVGSGIHDCRPPAQAGELPCYLSVAPAGPALGDGFDSAIDFDDRFFGCRIRRPWSRFDSTDHRCPATGALLPDDASSTRYDAALT